MSRTAGASTLTPAAITELRRKSVQYRRDILTFIMASQGGHTGGSLSCIDIINVLYNHVMNITPRNFGSLERDHYIQSKGHSVEALYVVLADTGFIDRAELEAGTRFRSHLIGHPTRKVHGVEHNTGGLGHGLSVATGLALAARLDGRDSRTFCLMGDGELAEGSNWEAAMSAAHYRLDNLVGIVDRNRLQITGDTEDVVRLEPLAEKWRSFGWEVREANGHDVDDLAWCLAAEPVLGKPTLVLAKTLKGRGVSFIEGQAGWHHHVPTREEFRRALAELDAAEAALEVDK